MSTNERDTHFQGFAKLLWHEVRKTSFDSPGFSEYQQLEKHLQLLFAQRAYDLVEYVLGQFPVPHTPGGVRDSIHWLQDMTVWPERERFANALADLAKIESKLPKPPTTAE